MNRFVKDKTNLRIVKDSQGKDIYLNNDSSSISGTRDIYLDKPIKVNKDIGNYQKGEMIVDGTNINEIFSNLFSEKTRENAYKRFELITDYLAYVEYDELDYTYALKYFKNNYSYSVRSMGGCISVRKGNLYGRNYDYFYDESEEFVVKVNKTATRHASIGIATCYFDKDEVEEGGFNYKYRVLPFYMMDGINDCGVTCNVNMLKPGQFPVATTGTKPDAKINICSLMLIRYILDNFSSAKEAVQAIKNDINFYCANNDIVHDEYHYMIADKKNTYIVEFINNEVIINEIFDKPIMSNYYYTNSKYNSDGTVDTTSLNDYSVGIERYNIISSNYNSITNSQSLRNVLKQCQMTKSYMKSTNPFWYSEYVGHYDEYGDITIRTPHDQMNDLIDDYVDKFQHRSRNKELWQTMHSSIYDLENKTLKVCIQEDWNNEYSYSLF